MSLALLFRGGVDPRVSQPASPSTVVDRESLARSNRLPSHIPALDGVRGLAVLLVLWCHCGAIIESDAVHGIFDRLAFSSARLATTGVDLFFVLSGFLITGILLDAKGSTNYFRNFYARRTVRIFPLYYLFLLVFLVLIPAVAPALGQALGRPPTSSIWYWLYLSNYSQSIVSYFGGVNEHPLHLTWSLAVEEQFYLFWPAVVYLVDRKHLLKLCGAMIVFSLALRGAIFCWLGKGSWQIMLDFTPCRLDGLATGAAIAIFARKSLGVRSLYSLAKYLAPFSAFMLFALIGLMAKLGYRSGLVASPGYAVFGCTLTSALFGSILVLTLCAGRGARLGAFFTSTILRSFGKYSYAIYLLHLPVIYFVSKHLFNPGDMRIAGTWLPTLVAYTILVSAITFVIALISWNCFEKHFLKLKKFFPTH